MKGVKKILCVIDPTADDHPAMMRAAWLAQKTAASLELFICIYDEYDASMFFDKEMPPNIRAQIVERCEEKLNSLSSSLQNDGVKVTTKVNWDRPLHEGIVREAINSKADIVFKDTHHHSILKRVILTNTDWNLIRTCPTPLWLVKDRELQSQPVIVAAIDPINQNDKPAALDRSILEMGRLLSETSDAELHAFHAYDSRLALATATGNGYIPVSLPYEEFESTMREQHKRRFDDAIESYQITTDRKHLVSGLTDQELNKVANDLPADVVIMGAIARNKLQRLFLGATAERVLEGLPCDMLIVKPDWFKTPLSKDVADVAA